MNSATFDNLCAIIREVYECVWLDWYSALIGVSRATLDIMMCCDIAYGAAYSHSRNLIVLPVAYWDLSSPDILDKSRWPIWKKDLIHEMLHEWQKKTPCLPATEADALFRRHGFAGSCEGYSPDFFQAILEKAPYFEMTAEQLIQKIC
jgi:hypothetical protein